MNTFVRPTKGGKVHLRGEDGSTKCFPGRYDTSQWETIPQSLLDDNDFCKSCIGDFSGYEDRSKRRQSSIPPAVLRPTRDWRG